MNIKLTINKRLNKHKENRICISISHGKLPNGYRKNISTSMGVKPEKWDDTKKRVIQYDNEYAKDFHHWYNSSIKKIERKIKISMLHFEHNRWDKEQVFNYLKETEDLKPLEDIAVKNNKYLLKRINNKLRSNMWSAIKKNGYKKTSRTHEILGCDFEFFRLYIETQFKKGMTWDNHGKWHFDHIIPVSSARTEQELIKLNHYRNFQPLWAEENLAKSNKIGWTGK